MLWWVNLENMLLLRGCCDEGEMRRRCEEWEVFRGIIIRSWEEGIKGRGILWSIYYEGEIYCKKEENEIYSFKIDKR